MVFGTLSQLPFVARNFSQPEKAYLPILLMLLEITKLAVLFCCIVTLLSSLQPLNK